jgi:hypothetical protein
MVSPSLMSLAAIAPMRRFSSACAFSRSFTGDSRRMVSGSTAPPCERRTKPRWWSAFKSFRMVTAEVLKWVASSLTRARPALRTIWRICVRRSSPIIPSKGGSAPRAAFASPERPLSSERAAATLSSFVLHLAIRCD